MSAPPLSPCERLEQALFDLLHLLSAADAPALAVVEQTLDPAGTATQFLAASEVRHALNQARIAVERAQQGLVQAFAAPSVLGITHGEPRILEHTEDTG